MTGYSVVVTENCAKALGVALPISIKHSMMICNQIRGKPVSKAKAILEDTIGMKKAIPFTKFTNGLGHKPGMAAGRYPVKACAHILSVLKSAEANAQYKGLSTADLIIKHISAKQGPGTMRQGRNFRSAKRTHIEVILEEVKARGKKE
ncbi:50S ribosomal protein L22 [Candidatus Woesearchaeota archaeon]|nr:50S ribosomal protein L22 [Candidatus Woesearchaeota archaeon]